jgi:hypothetical protein
MKDERPFNWSKDFVEHLRTVHFALAAVSLALIIAISAQDRRLPMALRQIEQIARFEKEWPGAQPHIYDYISSGQSVPWQIFLRTQALSFEPHQLLLRTQITRENLVQSVSWTIHGQPWPLALDTLDDFSRFWDDLSKGTDVFIPVSPDEHSNCWMAAGLAPLAGGVFLRRTKWESSGKCTVDSAINYAPYSWVPPLESTHIFRNLDNDYAYLQVRLELPQSGYHVVPPLPKESKIIVTQRIKLKVQKVHLTEEILSKVFFKDWQTGSFAHAFPELNAEASDFNTITLAGTEARVQLQATTASNSISLLGLTIPLIQLTRWGPLVLVATQLYFWLHLHELVRKIEPDADGWDVAWIGIYRTLPAFIVALFSACVLPAVAAICLGVTFVASHYYGRGVAIAGCSSIIFTGALLSILTTARLFRLRTMVETENRMTTSPTR